MDELCIDIFYKAEIQAVFLLHFAGGFHLPVRQFVQIRKESVRFIHMGFHTGKVNTAAAGEQGGINASTPDNPKVRSLRPAGQSAWRVMTMFRR